MGGGEQGPAVRQLRLVVHAPDFEQAVRFFRDALGMPEEHVPAGTPAARIAILDAGRATLEIVNTAQRDYIDDLEVGRPVARDIRVAFEVVDVDAGVDRLTGAGGELLAAPVETPWRSRNARLEAPAGLQITLFQELDG
jgi:predicted enzyme related to lactoylglutathione lyase